MKATKAPIFMGHQVQDWDTLRIDWKVPLPYHPTRAGLIERYNSLLKDALKTDSGSFQGWTTVFPTAYKL